MRGLNMLGAAMLVLAGCDGGSEAVPNNQAAAAANQASASSEAEEATPAPASQPRLVLAACEFKADQLTKNEADAASGSKPVLAPPPVLKAAPAYTLAANGLEPGIAFGMKQADAVAAAAAAFGAPGKPEHNDECGEGPMDFVGFQGLHLSFQEGKLVGWSLNEAVPALKTKGGLAVGSPRSALGTLEIDEESTLGPEFDAGGVGGVLDEQGAKVLALWAGYICQFR